MTKYEIISEALAQFDTLLTSSEIDDFETTLQENGLEIVNIDGGYSYNTILDLLVDIANVASKRSSNIIYDGQDNNGSYYQSQHCADIINYARKKIAAIT